MNVAPSTARAPSPAQPISTLLDAVRSLEGVSIRREQTCIVISAGRDHEDLKLHVEADLIALPDVNFEGNPELAIRVLHAWLPMFGAVELRDDDYTQIVDHAEPLDELLRRYRTKARADVEIIRTQIANVARGDDRIDLPTPSVRPWGRLTAIAVLAVLAALGCVWTFWVVKQRSVLGEACTNDRQCVSQYCVVPESFTPQPAHVVYAPSKLTEAFDRGVCSLRCKDDRDCPTTMTCRDATVLGASSRQVFEVRQCAPREWFDARTQ